MIHQFPTYVLYVDTVMCFLNNFKYKVTVYVINVNSLINGLLPIIGQNIRLYFTLVVNPTQKTAIFDEIEPMRPFTLTRIVQYLFVNKRKLKSQNEWK